MSFLLFGGLAIAGASNAFNQIIERDIDAQMHRTKNRPLPSGNMTQTMAFWIAVVLSISGLSALYAVNPKTAMFAAISMFLYTSVYTPLKTITPLSVFIGAFPGAIPFMLGWVSVTNKFGIEPGILFMLQFFWQFPHFWAISWVMHEDYQKAGFKMLPTGSKDRKTAFQITFYILWMILISLIPYTHYSGSLSLTQNSALLILILGIIMLYFSIDLMVKKSNKAASKLIIVSIFYLSIVQLVFIFDKYFLA